jgi:uncharacterized damage-inducible protein DinB
MNLAYLQTLLDYHYWARDIILDAVTELPREKFLQPVESSFKSVRDTVAHIRTRRRFAPPGRISKRASGSSSRISARPA